MPSVFTGDSQHVTFNELTPSRWEEKLLRVSDNLERGETNLVYG